MAPLREANGLLEPSQIMARRYSHKRFHVRPLGSGTSILQPMHSVWFAAATRHYGFTSGSCQASDHVALSLVGVIVEALSLSVPSLPTRSSAGSTPPAPPGWVVGWPQ